MILLDTDILTLFFQDHVLVARHLRAAKETPATSIITWIEILRGRFDSIFKAATAIQLSQAHQRLQQSVQQLAVLQIVQLNSSEADEFEKLLQNKSLRKLG